jgi:LPXTG-motif cell wall-anchored protein
MGTKMLIRTAMATATGVIAAVLLSVSPASATYFTAMRQCDGTVTLDTYGVGAGLHVSLSAHGVSWTLDAGEEATVTLPPIDGDTVHLVSDYVYEDGTTWTTDYEVPISPPPAEDCTPPETTAPPPTEPPPTQPPTTPPPPPEAGNPSWAVEPFCRNDTPYLSVSALLPPELAGLPVTLHWVDSAGNERHTQQVPAGTSEVLWPGAVVDSLGKPVDWPGWVEENDVWIEADDGFAWARNASVFLTVNPTSPSFAATYPPATPTCSAGPVVNILRATETPEGAPTLPETGSGPAPLVVVGLGLLAAGGALVVVTRQRKLGSESS